MHRIAPLLILTALLAPLARAEYSFDGFRNFSWGATPEEVKEQAGGTLINEDRLDPDAWNEDPYADFVNITLAPPATYLRFKGRRGERIEYYFADDRLTGVIHTLEGPTAFNARRVFNLLDSDLPDAVKSEAAKVDFPERWGVRLNQREEIGLTRDWVDTEQNRIRACAVMWPPDDIRKVLRVVHSSAAMNQAAVERNEQIAAEKAEQERLRREAEEAERQAREAAAAAAAAEE